MWGLLRALSVLAAVAGLAACCGLVGGAADVLEWETYRELQAGLLPDPRDVASAGASYVFVPPGSLPPVGALQEAGAQARLVGRSRDGGAAFRVSRGGEDPPRRTLLYTVLGGDGDAALARYQTVMAAMMLRSAERVLGGELGLEFLVMCHPAFCAELAARGGLPRGTRLAENPLATSIMGSSRTKVRVFEQPGTFGYDLVVFMDTDMLATAPFDPSPPAGSDALAVFRDFEGHATWDDIAPLKEIVERGDGRVYTNRHSLDELRARGGDIANCGFLAFRPTPRMKGHFDRVLADMAAHPDGFFEQASMNDVLYPEGVFHFIEPPQGSALACADIQANGNRLLWDDNALPSVMHLCGLPYGERLRAMCYVEGYMRDTCGHECGAAEAERCAREYSGA